VVEVVFSHPLRWRRGFFSFLLTVPSPVGITDNILNIWKAFSLSEEENWRLSYLFRGGESITARGCSCLVGKLLVDRIFGKDTIKSMLIRGWQPSGTTVVKNLGNNLFLIEFQHSWDKSRVLEGRPWVFEGHLFSVHDFDGAVVPVTLDFDSASF
jgi:hypothetical protein